MKEVRNKRVHTMNSIEFENRSNYPVVSEEDRGAGEGGQQSLGRNEQTWRSCQRPGCWLHMEIQEAHQSLCTFLCRCFIQLT